MRWRTRGPLVVAFAAVVVTFIAATSYSTHRLRDIDRLVEEISAAGLPCIRELTLARTHLAGIPKEATAAVDSVADGRPHGNALQGAAAALAQSLDLYRVLLTPGRRPPVLSTVPEALSALDGAIDRVMRQLDAGDLAAARARVEYDLTPAVERLDGILLELIGYHVEQVHGLAQSIRHTRRSSLKLMTLLDALAVMLAIIAAGLALRTVDRFLKLLEERNAELDQFAGRVAHDVLSPLTSVQLAIDRSEQQPIDETTHALLERARSGVRRVRQLVDALLAFARAGARPAEPARAAVQKVLDQVLDDVRERAREKGVQVVVEPCPPVEVACAEGVLQSVLSNLLQNALKYAATGPVRVITVRCLDRRTQVRLEVEDTGPGVPPGMERAVFLPYVRGPGTEHVEPGIGLGLATVRRIALAHGGQVGVRSRPGQGSCFWVDLPRGVA